MHTLSIFATPKEQGKHLQSEEELRIALKQRQIILDSQSLNVNRMACFNPLVQASLYDEESDRYDLPFKHFFGTPQGVLNDRDLARLENTTATHF